MTITKGRDIVVLYAAQMIASEKRFIGVKHVRSHCALNQSNQSCDKLWHSEMNLEDAHNQQNSMLKRQREDAKESRKHEHSRYVQHR